ncbi:NAD(P)/FAD-dependent oxidoreductase [Noviherbaspirillum sp. ST9]|uniref:NAD(P)/FAD-dependent oxidoreductase n=1 Tax=Noviherbaspirillum sp. ST9 TaxID=3401606 RepID=UPI003B588B93
MDRIDCAVIGAGVIGLAIARELAREGREVIVIERYPAIGMETSSRNSEVIHAGLYYPTGSLKARLCVQGRDALYDYCDAKGIAYRRCGKLVVATSDQQIPKLAAILRQAQDNGCAEVHWLDGKSARAMESSLSCVAALASPNTGIIDTHGYMLALQGDAEHDGAVFAMDSRVVSGRLTDAGVVLQVKTGEGEETELEASTLVNCGGLWAPHLAHAIEGLDPVSIPGAHFAKGNYYSLAGKAPFSRLIYPVPEPGGLGVHLTLDMGGQARFGPDVEWLSAPQEEIDYSVDASRAAAFYREIRAYWPDLGDDALQPAYSGVRPKITPPGAPAADFLFAAHGSPHYLGLYGIESPGLTASLAIAAHAAALLRK